MEWVVFTMAVRYGAVWARRAVWTRRAVRVRRAVRTRRTVWTRRAVLAAGGGAAVAGVLSGCSLFAGEQPDPPPDPLEPLLASTQALTARYQEEIAAHPDLTPRLDPIRQAHEAHAGALRDLIGPPLATSSAGNGVWSPPRATPTGTGEPAGVLDALAEAERAAEREARLACLAAPPERTGLLGSITAARATHVEVLTWSE